MRYGIEIHSGRLGEKWILLSITKGVLLRPGKQKRKKETSTTARARAAIYWK